MTDHLDALEQRINCLENIVFGQNDKDSLYPKEPRNDVKCVDTLVSAHQQTLSAVQGKKRIADAFKRLKDMKKFLDPAYIDEATLSDDARAEIILAEQEFLGDMAEQLKKVEDLKEVLDSEHLKSGHLHSDKLHSLCQIQIKQQDAVAEVTEETRNLLATYNNIISLISKQFVQWDEVLTKLEKSGKK